MAVKTKKQNKLDENFTFLRKLLTVDTLIEEVNQEEALEFLDAIENQYWEMKEALAEAEKEVKDLDAAIEKKDKEIEELKEESEDWETKASGAGFIMVRIENMQQEQLLSDFVNTHIWPNYNQQKDNVII
jgi:chromosome segregation ATPase